jgi:S1-C subfamily serine protease
MNRFLQIGSTVCLLAPLLLSSCASVFNGQTQDVKLRTRQPNATVYLNGKQEGEGRYTTLTLRRDKFPKQVRVEAEGYKPHYTALVQTDRPWLYYLTWFPFGPPTLFYSVLSDRGPKSYDYKDQYAITQQTAFKDRKEDEKYMLLEDLSFRVNKEDFDFRYYEDYDDFQAQTSPDDRLELEDDLDFTAEDGRDVMNGILDRHNYIDTTENIFRDKTNTVNLTAEIQEVDFDVCFPHSFLKDDKERVNVVKGMIEVNLAVSTIYGDQLYEETIEAESGTFTTKEGNEEALGATTRDALYQAVAEFLQAAEVRTSLEKEERKEPAFDMLTLQLGEAINGLNEAQQATVTVEVGDKGHGSGCVISRNGYIVTNYHVVAADKDNLTVRLNNGQKLDAELVRKNAYSDLALIKVDKRFDITYTIPTEKSYEAGMTTYAIGTPESVQLGQTLTKGIISGVREYKDNTYIQSDVSVNPGSSGGALVNEKGYIVGIVSSKVMGYSTEGLSFSFPAHMIDNRLGIRYETD